MNKILDEKENKFTHHGDALVMISLFAIISIYKLVQYIAPQNFILLWLLFMVTYIGVTQYLQYLGYVDEIRTLRNSIFFAVGARLMAT